MDTYDYEATTREGNIVTGTIEVASENLAVERIQEMGYFPLKVKKSVERESAIDRVLASFQNRITDKDLIAFTYQLSVLLDAGFPLERSLSILSELTEKKKFQDLLKEMISHVRSGKSFSDALARFPSVFPVFYVNMIKAGEAGGFVEDVISRMNVYLENSQALREDVRSALIYPMVIFLFSGIAVVVLLTFVIPNFAEIFEDMGAELPLSTVILLLLSEGLVKYWWVLLLSISGIVVGTKKIIESESGRQFWDRFKFRLPVFGKLYREAAVSRFARTFGTLLDSGVPILNALQIVKGTLENEKISEIISSVREAVRKGRGISEPFKNSDIFPPIAVHMITVGEESGKLNEMLIKISDRFDIEVKTTVKRLLSLLEPVLIIFMAVIIGFIVISMLLAIFSINDMAGL
ncbi:MAG: type II secretion system F family protein [Nitrospirota bacterium]